MGETKRPSWPKLPSGVTDWETVFEDPKIGLIPRISKVRTISALRDSTVLIAKRLCARENDPTHLGEFINEIKVILPEDLPGTTLMESLASIIQVLRRIKTERIERAEAFLMKDSGAKSFDHQVERESAPAQTVDRRQQNSPPPPATPDSPKTPTLPGAPGAPKNRALHYGGIGVAVLIACVALVLIIKKVGTEDELTPVQQFIEQMTAVAEGSSVDRHVFGGQIIRGRSSGRTTVSTDRVPKNACASAAWVLLNRGTIVVNGVLPTRVTSKILKEICEKKGNHANLVWYPKTTKKAKN
jgi:hypothetical protein